MTSITINETEYRIHPEFDLYAGSKNGKIINIVKKKPFEGYPASNGYKICFVRRHKQRGYKNLYVHRFIYECFNGHISNHDMVIDHINSIRDDNRLCNLKLVTQQENCKKSAKDRDYSFLKYNHKNKKFIKATNLNTNKVTFFNSMYSCSKNLGINAGIIKMVSEGLNNCKSGYSKVDKDRYKFEYVNQKDMPSDFIKMPNIRPKGSIKKSKKHE